MLACVARLLLSAVALVHVRAQRARPWASAVFVDERIGRHRLVDRWAVLRGCLGSFAYGLGGAQHSVPGQARAGEQHRRRSRRPWRSVRWTADLAGGL